MALYIAVFPHSLYIYIYKQKVCTVSNRSCVDLGTRLKSTGCLTLQVLFVFVLFENMHVYAIFILYTLIHYKC